MKFTLEEKLANVKLHIEDGIPLHEIAKTRGHDLANLKFCVALYRRCGGRGVMLWLDC